jgi:hypothetical protein
LIGKDPFLVNSLYWESVNSLECGDLSPLWPVFV